MNLLILFIEIVISTLLLIYMYKKYKNDGIYLFIMIVTIILSIMSVKKIELFTFELNLDIVLNSLLFISSTIMVHKKGPNEIRKILTLIVISSMMLFLTSTIVSLITCSEINNISNLSFNSIFNFKSRVYIGMIVSLCISLFINSYIYHLVRQVRNKILLSNVLSIIISSFVECVLFIVIGYSFEIRLVNMVELMFVRYIIKVILCVMATRLIYLLNDIR